MTPLIVILHNYSASTENPSWILQLLLKAKADINQASNVSIDLARTPYTLRAFN